MSIIDFNILLIAPGKGATLLHEVGMRGKKIIQIKFMNFLNLRQHFLSAKIFWYPRILNVSKIKELINFLLKYVCRLGTFRTFIFQ